MTSAEFREDPARAFVPGGVFTVAPHQSGPLDALTFGVKDLIDIAGHVTGAGHPGWAATHAAAQRHAPCVETLLEHGATCVGKTLTDELAYSVNGDNVHYGTPVNVNAPGHTPGGSSSGSAAAVAAGSCDFALASDTGGSTRIPASYCGLFGIRTTHGRIPCEGVVPLMPSYDTVTWLARRFDVFAKVGEILLGSARPQRLRRLLVLRQAFEGSDVPTCNALVPGVEWLSGHLASVEVADVHDGPLEDLRRAYLTSSAHEGWRVHRDWIESTRPVFSEAVRLRFEFARSVTDEEAARAERFRNAFRARLADTLSDDCVAVLPTAPFPALSLQATAAEVDAARTRIFRLTSIAGLAGTPQISLPVGAVGGLPVGLSLLARAGTDEELIALAGQLATACGIAGGWHATAAGAAAR